MAPILARNFSRFDRGAQDDTMDAILKANADALGGGAGSMFYIKKSLDQLSARLPEDSSPADVVYEHLNDLRALDSNPKMNLASFVTTSMEEPAKRLIMDSLNVNQIDGNIYSSSRDIERRCVEMLADIFHASMTEHMGTATVGSTEACLLAGLNMKKRWEEARQAKGLPTSKPNMIISAAYQVCWKKLSAYWDIEMRLGLLGEDKYTLEPEDVERLADENTIGVVAVLGSTYTGHYDNVEALSAMCDKLQASKGYNLEIHVDAASGGFVAPFLMPDLVWDFRLPRVLSISVSGHKSGLVYPGVGWLVLRHKNAFHPSLVFHLSYLGIDQTDITLNFSRPAAMICAQYYMLLRMGRKGFEVVARSTTQIAHYVFGALQAMGMVMHSARPGTGQPLVVFALPPLSSPKPTNGTGAAASAPGDDAVDAPGGGPVKPTELERPYTCFELAEKLRERGWSVPAYRLAHNMEHVLVIRLVIRAEFSMLLADALLKDIRDALESLDAHYAKLTRTDRDHIAESIKHLAPLKAPSTKPKPGAAHVVC